LEELQVTEVDLAKQRSFASLIEHHERLRGLQREALRQSEHFCESALHGYYGEAAWAGVAD
jgi:SAM-dependent MidA family methyltransferase